MLAAERRDLLVARLRLRRKLVARDLAAEFGVSEDSAVRRDLQGLAAAGLCQRVYGGALPVSPAIGTYTRRAEIAPESKHRVGALAAALITPGTTVIVDGGTTGRAIAAALPPDLSATIITHSPTTAAVIADHPSVELIVLGGKVQKAPRRRRLRRGRGRSGQQHLGRPVPARAHGRPPEGGAHCRGPRRGRDAADTRQPGRRYLRGGEHREDRDSGTVLRDRPRRNRRSRHRRASQRPDHRGIRQARRQHHQRLEAEPRRRAVQTGTGTGTTVTTDSSHT